MTPVVVYADTVMWIKDTIDHITEMNTMKLYHGSAYKTDVLKPGIKHTGVKIDWDNTESNEWLYASSDRTEATMLGFFSYLEKHHGGTAFHMSANEIIITSDPFELDDIKVYLYSINTDKGWVKVNNQSNNSVTEYKTKNHIKPDKIEEIVMSQYLRNHNYVIKTDKGKLIPNAYKHSSLRW